VVSNFFAIFVENFKKIQAMDKGQGKRRPVDPMRHHRENGWDYKGRAIYHFTLPVEERYPLFGTLRSKAEARHYAYAPIPVTSQRYRFVVLNEMAKRLTQDNW
jgi:hypothetical protein